MDRSSLVFTGAALALAAAGCGLNEKFPERAIFVANGGDGTISVIDPADGRVVGEIEVDAGFHPHHLAISPDGTKVSVAAPNVDLSKGHGGDHAGAASKVYLFDASSGSKSASADVAATVHNVAFLDDFSSVALAMMEHGMIAGYGASKLDEQWTLNVGKDPLEVTPVTGGRLLVANSGDGTISIVDGATHAVLDTAAVGDMPIAVWNTPTGLFVSLEGDKKVAILSSGNLKDVTGTYDTAGVPGQVIATKSGGDVWIAVESRGVVEVRAASNGAVTQTIDVGGKPHGLLFDPKANLVYVTDEAASRVIRIDATKYTITDEITVGAAPNGIVQNSF